MAAREKIDIWEVADLFKKQQEFLYWADRHAYMLYGGARGGGKSRLLRWGLIIRLLQWAQAGNKNVRVGLFSEDYPTLKDRQVTKLRAEMPSWLGVVKSTQDEGLGFYIHEQWGGGAILLRNLDDPSKYQSAEFAGIAVEELTKSPITVFDTLVGSLRWPGIEDTFFWGATNPGGVGHLWVKALWVDRDYSGDYERFEKMAHEFRFVPSLPKDNPHLTESYWEKLEQLPPSLKEAWVNGNWDAFEGQAFTEWNRKYHVTEFMPEDRRVSHQYVWTAGGDWGYSAQGCLYLMATGGEHSIVRHEWLFKGMDPYDVGFNYGQVLRGFPIPDWIALDEPPVPDGGPTIIERFTAGLKDSLVGRRVPAVIQPPRGRGSRYAKKQLMHEALRYEREAVFTKEQMGQDVEGWMLPNLLIHESCKYLIRTLPALPLKENDNEDIDTDSDDHGYDAVTGWMMARIPHVEREKRKRSHPDNHPGFKERYGLGQDEDEGVRWSRDVEMDEIGAARWTR